MEITGVHIQVEGRVQGVGYRYFVLENALAHGVKGWVRNLPDANVEVVAEGPRRMLELFITQLERGPVMARVSRLNTEWHPPVGQFTAFEIR